MPTTPGALSTRAEVIVSKLDIAFAISDSVTAVPVAPEAKGCRETTPGFRKPPTAAEFASVVVITFETALIAEGA